MGKLSLPAGALIALAVSVCSPSRDALSIDAGTPIALLDAGPNRELIVSVKAQLPDGGFAPMESQPNARAVIDPTQKLELSTNVALHNYRIRVFDEADRAMISEDRADGSDDEIQYQILFREPLKPGHRYTLVLDGQTGSSFTDGRGNAQGERRLEFQVSGDKAKAPVRKSPSKKRRRR
jgi:hypothetical protein